METSPTSYIVRYPANPPGFPHYTFVDSPEGKVTYSNENLLDLDGKTWTKSEYKDYAKPRGHLFGILFFLPDWGADFDIHINSGRIETPAGWQIVPSDKLTVYTLQDHPEYNKDVIDINGVKYCQIADITGDAKKSNISENRIVAASAFKAREEKKVKKIAAILVCDVFTNPGNLGESGTAGGGTNMIGNGPISANMVVASASGGLTKKVGVAGIRGTLYGCIAQKIKK